MGRKSQEPLTLVAGSAPTLTDPPPTLREAGATLWRSIMAEYAITDSGGRAILEQACASADRAAECSAIIADQTRPQGPPVAATRDGCPWPCWPPAYKVGARRRAAATDLWPT